MSECRGPVGAGDGPAVGLSWFVKSFPALTMVGFRAMGSCSERGLALYARGFPLGAADELGRGRAAFQPRIHDAAESGARGVGLEPGSALRPCMQRAAPCEPPVSRGTAAGLRSRSEAPFMPRPATRTAPSHL